MTELLSALRKFWYNNTKGTFSVGGYEVTRQEIDIHGGPNPEYKCLHCQQMEWLSRIKQENLCRNHNCTNSTMCVQCQNHCSRQGNELWTHYHQKHLHALGCDPELNASKCIMVQTPAGVKATLGYSCDHATMVFVRQFARACQFDITSNPNEVKWDNYDFAVTFTSGAIPKFNSPIPLVLSGHDLWKHHNMRQDYIDYFQPNYFMTPYITSWKTHYSFPDKTKLRFRCIAASQFFTRPNLREKEYDLLSIGAVSHPIYEPRKVLRKQIEQIGGNYRIGYFHRAGAKCAKHDGANQIKDTHYLNKWSELLGKARYVIFGPIAQKPQAVFHKYYECLGSGAIPIMPFAPDLNLLGIEPMRHYIPLKNVWGDNSSLRHYLDNYKRYRYIAENAVSWHEENADRWLFDGFENFIQEVTNCKYPRRLL